MAKTNRAALKLWFETGDKPTEAQFASLIDSFINFLDDTTGFLLAGTEIVFFDGAGKMAGGNLFWDESNKRLGINESLPDTKVHATDTTLAVYLKTESQHVSGSDAEFGVNTEGIDITNFTAGKNFKIRLTNGGTTGVFYIENDGRWSNHTPSAVSSVLDLASTTKGILIPRLTIAQRDAIAAPATGLLIFNVDNVTFEFYNSANWQAIMNNADKVLIGGALRTLNRVKFDINAATTTVVAAVAAKQIYVVGIEFTCDTDATTFKLVENTVGDLTDAQSFAQYGGKVNYPAASVLWATATINKALDITTTVGKATGTLWYCQF